MVVSIDYTKMEAIRAVEGVEERQRLTHGRTSGFAVCTWLDGSTYQSAVANLILDVKRAPLKTKAAKPKAAMKKSKAAKKKPSAAAHPEESDEGREGEQVEEEEEDSGCEVDEPAARKGKIAKEDEDLTHTYIYIYIYIYCNHLRQAASAPTIALHCYCNI
jgi:hypothetical protein